MTALWFRRICFVLFVLIGTMMLFQSIRNMLHIHAAEKWIETEAHVDSIYVIKHENKRGGSFFPVIAFHYNVNGAAYSGDQFTIGSSTAYVREWEAQLIAERCLDKNDSSNILIYYDPENPGSSTISRGNMNAEYQLVYFGVVFLTLGLLANRKEMIALIKRSRKKKAE